MFCNSLKTMPQDKPSQIISRQRVADHGEVFTAEREVKAMCDLVRHETERIESRFLEPACGQGAFLMEILRRKLDVVTSRFRPVQSDWEENAVVAVSSLYGIEILQDNLAVCRQNLYDLFSGAYRSLFGDACREECLRAVRLILELNILWGDALTLKTPEDMAHPIVFAEWSDTGRGMLKRRDYTLANLLENQPVEGLNLFSDLGDRAFIPKPIREYPLVHFLKLGE